MILNDVAIRELSEKGMIDPFYPDKVEKNVLSYGCAGMGYDLRLSYDIKVEEKSDGVADPKSPPKYRKLKIHEESIINPGEIWLASTMETVDIPINVLAELHPKSTYARLGLSYRMAPVDPGFKGNLTICLSNPTDRPIRLYRKEGILQIIFFKGEDSETPYAGKYQNSNGAVESRIQR